MNIGISSTRRPNPPFNSEPKNGELRSNPVRTSKLSLPYTGQPISPEEISSIKRPKSEISTSSVSPSTSLQHVVDFTKALSSLLSNHQALPAVNWTKNFI